jgi:hypothetical protein
MEGFMRARIVPMRMKSGNLEKFNSIFDKLKEIYADEVEFLSVVMMGEDIPEADAILFPNMEVDVYISLSEFNKYKKMPILVITTLFGVSLMFDWEAVAYLKRQGFKVFNPHSVELAKTIFMSLALKREMKEQKFLIFQDTPGDGLIPEQFKIFYWWNDECTQDIKDKFGITILRKSFKDFGKKAKSISDDVARKEIMRWDFKQENVKESALLASVKLFIALRDEVDRESNVVACGINCLNEAYDSETTPCFAYNLLYRDRGIIWGCESDTSALMTQYLLAKVIDSAIFTTNIYPFLSGMPALSHEKIQNFPDVEDPDNHALLVHCGYLCCSLAQKYATRWVLRPPVLDWLVGENGVAIDGDVALGDITMSKLHSDFKRIQVTKAKLEEFVQYPGSDCRNGGLIRISDGYRLMENICSHHVIVNTGKRSNQIKALAAVFDLLVDEI